MVFRVHRAKGTSEWRLCWWLSAMVVASGVAGCAGDTSDADDTTLTKEQVLEQRAQYYCPHLVECCGQEVLDEIVLNDFRLGIPEECEAFQIAANAAWIGLVSQGESLGRLRFNADSREQCQKEYEAKSCGDAFGCGARITPLVAVGGECNSSLECIDSICLGIGRCGLPRSEGEGCLASNDCQSELFCDTTDDGVCATPHADGEACVFSDECAGGTCMAGYCATDADPDCPFAG